jgi:hypothetical protein
MNRLVSRFVVLAFCFAFIFSATAQAQATLGAVNGTVTDKTGAVV